MKTEFEIDGTRYTPEPLSYNGVQGYLWWRRQREVNAWMLDGKLFLPDGTTRAEVIEAFDEFDNTGCD